LRYSSISVSHILSLSDACVEDFVKNLKGL
jgi:hypothetical protein